jgi:hypothetical protein
MQVSFKTDLKTHKHQPDVCKSCGKDLHGKRYNGGKFCSGGCVHRHRTKINPTRMKNPARNSALKRRYGITQAQYLGMIKAQGGKCAICQQVSPKPLVIDHNHETGEVRGLLCHFCNTAIGLLEENRLTLINALQYLETHNGN